MNMSFRLFLQVETRPKSCKRAIVDTSTCKFQDSSSIGDNNPLSRSRFRIFSQEIICVQDSQENEMSRSAWPPEFLILYMMAPLASLITERCAT